MPWLPSNRQTWLFHSTCSWARKLPEWSRLFRLPLSTCSCNSAIASSLSSNAYNMANNNIHTWWWSCVTMFHCNPLKWGSSLLHTLVNKDTPNKKQTNHSRTAPYHTLNFVWRGININEALDFLLLTSVLQTNINQGFLTSLTPPPPPSPTSWAFWPQTFLVNTLTLLNIHSYVY